MNEKFVELYQEDVSKYSEEKNKFTYLSWAFAQKKGKELDENFEWHALANEQGKLVHDGMVLIEMNFLGKTYRHYFPILNYSNKAIANPNGFDINTAQMRGMAKLFAMISGYGLSLYTGEDIKNLDETGKQAETDAELIAVQKDFKKYYKAITKGTDELKKEKMITAFNNSDVAVNGTLDNDRLQQLPIIKFKLLTVELGKIAKREEE